MHSWATDSSAAEELPEVLDERVDPDGLFGQQCLVVDMELATACGGAQVGPIGGPVTGATEAWKFNEGLEQDRAVAMEQVPVL